MDTHENNTERQTSPHPGAKGDLELDTPGIITELGKLGPNALVTEKGLAKIFRRHPVSVKRAVQRGELPPPTSIMGRKRWTVRVLLEHFETKLTLEASESERTRRRLAELEP